MKKIDKLTDINIPYSTVAIVKTINLLVEAHNDPQPIESEECICKETQKSKTICWTHFDQMRNNIIKELNTPQKAECDCYCHYTPQVLTTQKGATLRKECSHCEHPTPSQPEESKKCGHECTSSCYKDYDCPCDTQHEHSQPDKTTWDVKLINKIGIGHSDACKAETGYEDDCNCYIKKIAELLAERDDTAYAKGIIKGREQARHDLIQELEREVEKKYKWVYRGVSLEEVHKYNAILKEVLDILEKARGK